MELVRIIGIIAMLFFLVAYIGGKVIGWFTSGEIVDRIVSILVSVSTGALTIGTVCGIIHLLS